MKNILVTWASVLFLSSAIESYAQDIQVRESLYWDSNGAEIGFGEASGIWGIDPFWSTDERGGLLPERIGTTRDDDLYIGSEKQCIASGTISLEGTQELRSLTIGQSDGSIVLTNGALSLSVPLTPFRFQNQTNQFFTSLTGEGGLSLSRIFDEKDCSEKGFILPGEWKTIFFGKQLSEIENCQASFSGGSISSLGIKGKGFHSQNDGELLSMQFQVFDGFYTKCVKILFRQNGKDIEAKALYAGHYKKWGENKVGIDFDGDDSNISRGDDVATREDQNSYGITQFFIGKDPVAKLSGNSDFRGDLQAENIDLHIDGEGNLGNGVYAGTINNNSSFTWASSSHQTLTGILEGVGTYTFRGGNPHFFRSIERGEFLVPWVWTKLGKGTVQDLVAVTNVIMGGGSLNAYGTLPPASNLLYATVCHFKQSGDTATCQIQAVDDTWLKCVILDIREKNGQIEMKPREGRYVASEGHAIGFDFDRPREEAGWMPKSIAQNKEEGGYGVASLSLIIRDRGLIVLDGNAKMTRGIQITDGAKIVARNANALPSSGGIRISQGARLTLAGELGPENPGGIGNGNPIYVDQGGILVLDGIFTAGQTRLISIDGGCLRSAHGIEHRTGLQENEDYVNNLTLANGARVEGYPLRLLYNHPRIHRVTGNSPSYLTCGAVLVRNWDGKRTTLTNLVEDVTKDDRIDFYVSGPLQDYPGLTGANYLKTGAGTIDFAVTNTLTGDIEIEEGVLRLGNNVALNSSNQVLLEGGTLDLGSSTNKAKLIILKDSSTIHLAKGELILGNCDQTSWTEGKLLTVTGTLRPHSLRFGTNANGLTPQQLSAIRHKGRRVMLTAQGYLQETPRSTLLLLN